MRSNLYGGARGLERLGAGQPSSDHPDTVRYYERLGLLPETGRTGGGHRYYDEAALERLRFIKGAQWFELRSDEIRELLELFDADGCACGCGSRAHA
ncbi:MAG TPA: MerR family transcriptional regulator [Acidimicrobiales bacterium]|nr:MerR family transcriptional regulator [Acidimicrobiales bacterium]